MDASSTKDTPVGVVIKNRVAFIDLQAVQIREGCDLYPDAEKTSHLLKRALAVGWTPGARHAVHGKEKLQGGPLKRSHGGCAGVHTHPLPHRDGTRRDGLFHSLDLHEA